MVYKLVTREKENWLKKCIRAMRKQDLVPVTIFQRIQLSARKATQDDFEVVRNWMLANQCGFHEYPGRTELHLGAEIIGVFRIWWEGTQMKLKGTVLI